MTERNINQTIGALTLGLAFSIGALAEELAKDSYKARKEAIEAEYKAAKSACASLGSNHKDLGVNDAKAAEAAAKADAQATMK